MKKTFKNIVLVVIALVGVLTLAGCNHANTYNKFHNNGSNLAKSHILKEISIGDLKDLIKETINSKVNDGEVVTYKDENGNKVIENQYIYVFLGTPTDSDSTSKAVVFDEQAKQYGVPVLYWIDTDLSSSKLEKLNNILLMASDVKKNTSALISICNGGISFDSTSIKCNTKDGVAGSTALTDNEIAQNCFKNLTSVTD